jgi:hypothetical protein
MPSSREVVEIMKEIKMMENQQNIQNNNEYIYEIIDEIVDGADSETNIDTIEKDLNKIFRKDTCISEYSIKIKCFNEVDIFEKQIFMRTYVFSFAWIDSLGQLNHYITSKNLYNCSKEISKMIDSLNTAKTF